MLTKTLAALAITTIVAFCADNSLGTWKLNTEKSKYTPAPMPLKSLTTTREASDGGVKVTNTGEQANGTAINATYTGKYDGKDVEVTGSAPYDTISFKQVNANTFTDQRQKTGGPYHATGRTVISNGGKTMTLTAKGTNQDGKKFIMTLVFEKQ
jgi:hypothetical protein